MTNIPRRLVYRSAVAQIPYDMSEDELKKAPVYTYDNDFFGDVETTETKLIQSVVTNFCAVLALVNSQAAGLRSFEDELLIYRNVYANRSPVKPDWRIPKRKADEYYMRVVFALSATTLGFAKEDLEPYAVNGDTEHEIITNYLDNVLLALATHNTIGFGEEEKFNDFERLKAKFGAITK